MIRRQPLSPSSQQKGRGFVLRLEQFEFGMRKVIGNSLRDLQDVVVRQYRDPLDLALDGSRTNRRCPINPAKFSQPGKDGATTIRPRSPPCAAM